MSLPKRNSADGRCYWMKPEVQEELQPLFDQCIQDAIDGRITRLDSLWPPVVVSSEGAPFEVFWQLYQQFQEHHISFPALYSSSAYLLSRNHLLHFWFL